jgi:putative spermidine/putrescine transport system ATP-binding protein
VSGSVEPALVELSGVGKTYDGTHWAVADLDLTVRRGEFLTLLGPSGSGKTTTLMMLAGFERISRGDIRLDGASLADKPPHRRNMGVVFQNYALFPHMSVARNLAFPLAVRGIRGAEADARIDQALALVNLEGMGDRRINTISGGQQQRVALARALIFDPDVVLMDEPLGALDRQLREKLQVEIKQIQRRTGITVIYVTHDQVEALAMSDRIAVFAGGRLQQVGTPRAIYDQPANAFVAGFIGENNRLDGVVVERTDDRCTVEIAGGAQVSARASNGLAPGDHAIVTVRPEAVRTGKEAGALANRFDAVVEDRLYLGDHTRIYARLPGGGQLTARSPGAVHDDHIALGWTVDSAFAFAQKDAVGGTNG